MSAAASPGAGFISETQFVASDWNELVGTLSNSNQTISWANSTSWSVPAPRRPPRRPTFPGRI